MKLYFKWVVPKNNYIQLNTTEGLSSVKIQTEEHTMCVNINSTDKLQGDLMSQYIIKPITNRSRNIIQLKQVLLHHHNTPSDLHAFLHLTTQKQRNLNSQLWSIYDQFEVNELVRNKEDSFIGTCGRIKFSSGITKKFLFYAEFAKVVYMKVTNYSKIVIAGVNMLQWLLFYLHGEEQTEKILALVMRKMIKTAKGREFGWSGQIS